MRIDVNSHTSKTIERSGNMITAKRTKIQQETKISWLTPTNFNHSIL